MANTKTTALTGFTPVLTDIGYGVDDPGGTPISGKFTFQSVMDLFEANMTVPASVSSAYLTSTILASTSNAEGASLIGVEDVGTYWTGTDVEAVLAEIGALKPAEANADVTDQTNVVAALSGATLTGNIDIGGQSIVSSSNGNITLAPNGTGNVILGNYVLDADATVGAGQDNYVLTFDNGTGLWSPEAVPGSTGNAWSDAVDSDILPTGADSTYDVGSATAAFAEGHFDTIYVGGTQFSGTSLSDPGADRILFWDDSAGSTAYLTASTGLTISTTSLTVDTSTIASLANLASTSNALGASLIGIEDAGTLITATTVEGALAENRTAIDAIEADYLTSSSIGVSVQGYDADTLKADTADQLTAGFTAATDDDSTAASPYTPDHDTGNYKRVINDGAMTINGPTMASGESTSMVILLTNTTGAGAITFGTTTDSGDTIGTTTTDEYLIFITAVDVGGTTYSHASVKALQ